MDPSRRPSSNNAPPSLSARFQSFAPNEENEMLLSRVIKMEMDNKKRDMEIARLVRIIEEMNRDVSAPVPPAAQPDLGDTTLDSFLGACLHTLKAFFHTLNTGNFEDLQRLKGIGNVRAEYILQVRADSSDPQPFKSHRDLEKIRVPRPQIPTFMSNLVAEAFRVD